MTAAQDYYRQGQELYGKVSRENNDEAMACFEKAIELDPTHAPALVGLSLAYAQRAGPLGLGRKWLDDAISAAERAVGLAPDLVDGYRALSRVYYSKGWYRKHLEASRKVLEFDSNDRVAIRDTGWALWFTGAADEALPYLRKTVTVDPEFRWSHFWLGNASFTLELYDQAEEMYGKAVETKNLSSAHIGLICTYLCQGKEEPARQHNRRFRANPDQDRYFVKAADVEMLLGNFEEARQFAERAIGDALDARYMPRGVCPTTILGCVLWDNDRQEAERHLDQSVVLDRRRLDGGNDGFEPFYDLAAVHAIRSDVGKACHWLWRAIDAGWRSYRSAM